MSGNKALRRALATTDAIRVNAKVPLITDTTELISPQKAQEMLEKNKRNRPINWKKVEEWSELMKQGKWELHAQGIVLDGEDNILTGQKRLWAIVYSGVNVYMRVSRGNPSSAAKLMDRGIPQSARDLATRDTNRKHSPAEASIARAIYVMRGVMKPSTDELAELISANSHQALLALKEIAGTARTKSVLMILAAVCELCESPQQLLLIINRTSQLADRLDAALLPESSARCWGKGAAFGLAMAQARKIVTDHMNEYMI